MLRIVSIMTGLLFFNPAGAASARSAIDDTCPTGNRELRFPTCENKYESICSKGDFFLNKMPTLNLNYLKASTIIQNQRKISGVEAQLLANRVYGKLDAQRHKIFKSMNNKVFNAWQEYFKLLIDVAVKTHGHNTGKGACGEATKASIANSLLKQLETNTRETVQLIIIDGAPISVGSADLPNPNHVFAIYNSKKITTKTFKTNAELQNLMSNLKSENPNYPVVTCDSWAAYQGKPERWLQYIQNGKDHFYGAVNWKKMQVTDYSIPSMRQHGMTPQQRKFLTELMRDEILRPAIYESSNRHSPVKKS